MNAAIRLTALAAALMVSTSATTAEPARPPASRPEPPKGPAQVVLASAETVQAPAAGANAQPQPPRHRVARVTTCRCGDPQPDPESHDQ